MVTSSRVNQRYLRFRKFKSSNDQAIYFREIPESKNVIVITNLEILLHSARQLKYLIDSRIELGETLQ